MHCLDFRTLKRRLIDDPPDPYDDHPSMAGPTEATAATASADARDPAPRNSSSSTASLGGGGGRDLLADPERDGLGASAPGEGNGGAREGWRMQAGEGGEDGGVVGGIQVVFPNPSSRVFVFEINQVGAVCIDSLSPTHLVATASLSVASYSYISLRGSAPCSTSAAVVDVLTAEVVRTRLETTEVFLAHHEYRTYIPGRR